MEKATSKNKKSRGRGEKTLFFIPPFGEVFFYEVGLLVGLISLFLAGVAWPIDHLNSTRVDPTTSFALANPFPAADLADSNVVVRMRATTLKQPPHLPCQPEKFTLPINIQPNAGQEISTQPTERPFASNLRPIILISSTPKT